MNEFTRLAEQYRDSAPTVDAVELGAWLAGVPCGPLYKTHVTPDAALRAAAEASS